MPSAPATAMGVSALLIFALSSADAYTVPEVEGEQRSSKHWAVLVAGSSGYGNYRHQADVCHAYQIMVANNIPKEQIIVMAVDDVASSPENPVPGKLFNKPTPAGVLGVDVYAGCAIDYKGADVTPANFVKVLTGDAEGLAQVGTGKVLKSTSKHKVFINFVDHGAVGLIGFPSTTMHAVELVGALMTMHNKQMYKELVFYLESCESGSMFQALPNNMQIYATTAANAHESSWGTYCMPNSTVDGVDLRTCLGDLYSVNWMENDDTHDATVESLSTQFEVVKNLTTRSHVMQFGDLTFTAEPVVDFEGAGRPLKSTPKAARATTTLGTPSAMLPSPDAALASAYDRFMATGSDLAAEELKRGVQERQDAKARFGAVVRHVLGEDEAQLGEFDGNFDHACHYEAHKAYKAACGEWTEGSLAYSATLAQLCKHTSNKPKLIITAIKAVCAA